MANMGVSSMKLIDSDGDALDDGDGKLNVNIASGTSIDIGDVEIRGHAIIVSGAINLTDSAAQLSSVASKHIDIMANISNTGIVYIGASGVVYALASFIFFSGLIKKQTKLSAASLLVIFLYGSMIWGVLPIYDGVSWEGHLAGLLAGLLLAIFYRNEGPKPKKYQWEIDEELEKEMAGNNDVNIKYFYKE